MEIEEVQFHLDWVEDQRKAESTAIKSARRR